MKINTLHLASRHSRDKKKTTPPKISDILFRLNNSLEANQALGMIRKYQAVRTNPVLPDPINIEQIRYLAEFLVEYDKNPLDIRVPASKFLKESRLIQRSNSPFLFCHHQLNYIFTVLSDYTQTQKIQNAYKAIPTNYSNKNKPLYIVTIQEIGKLHSDIQRTLENNNEDTMTDINNLAINLLNKMLEKVQHTELPLGSC